MNTFVNLIPSKNFIFLVLSILFSININAQTTETKDSLNTKQEVRLDLFQLIVLPGIDVSYERFIDNLSSWGVLTSGEYDYYPIDYNYDSSNNSGVKDFFGLAGGALIGRKWVNQKKYTFEIHAGVGRYFAFEKTNNAYREGTAYPRINFAIGKRF